MLIKKTVVLARERTVGYVTLVRVGGTVGVKTVINEPCDEALYLGLKIGENPQFRIEVGHGKTETELDAELTPFSQIGAIVLTADGKLFASGGVKDTVNKAAVLPTFEESAYSQTTEEVDVNQNFGQPQIEVEEPKSTNTVNEGQNGNRERYSPFSMNKGEKFYENIRARLEEIMTANPAETALAEIIPESKWVKVYYDKDEYYVVGVLAEDGKVTYIAYGVPGIEGIKPPPEAEELCDFLPIPNTIGEGYWLMFQNVKNGEIVKTI